MTYTPYAPIPMLPGPVSVHPDVLEAMNHDYGSGQIDADFLALYARTGKELAALMGTSSDVVFMSGEAMLGLWGALKSTLTPDDTVLTIGTGVFGDGFGDMAASFGCNVEKISLPYSSTIGCGDSLQRIEETIRRVQPTMITAVHCETPSGTLNPLDAVGEMKKRLGVPLFYVDAVASVGGVPVQGDAWNADLLLAGTQKCLAAPPSLSAVAVSPMAWEYIERVKYSGYDAFLPFRSVQEDGRCPYTPYWHGLAAVAAAIRVILTEGVDKVFARHEAVATQCRDGLAKLGIPLFTDADAVNAPTVTAAMLPKGLAWKEWQKRLWDRGLVVSGSFGPMAGKVFRLGHMGTQASPDLMRKALAVMAEAL